MSTLADRIPPHDQDAEQATLGAMLMERQAIGSVRPWLQPYMFYGQVHQSICEATYALFDRGEPVDAVTLSTHLRDQERLDDVGGMRYLLVLLDAVPTAANVEQYARAVKAAATRRALIGQAHQMIGLAHDTGRPVEELIVASQQGLVEIASQGFTAKWEPARALVARVYDEIEANVKAQRGHHPGVKSGLPALDTITGGWQKGELIVIAARPGHGKTALALQFAVQAAREGVTAGFVTLEQSAEALTRRMLAQAGDVSASEVQFSYIADDEGWSRLVAVSSTLYSLPLHFWDVGSATVGDIRARATELAAREPLGLLLVDYLQLIKLPPGADMRVGTTLNIRALKALAKDLQIPVIVLSQLTRAAEQEGRRPRLSDLRETGAIEDEADRVLFIYFETPVQRKQGGPAWLLLEKNRNGLCRDFGVYWQPSRLRFTELALDDASVAAVEAQEW